MKFGIHIPIHGQYSDPNLLLDLAVEAERAGWDGFFLWDHITMVGKAPQVADPWIVLAAIAARTKDIRLGTMVTPLARRRPWKVARETVAIDHLSKGRLILGVGLGALGKAEFANFGEDDSIRTRAEKLDEGLALLMALWSGEQVNFEGKYYQVKNVRFLPKPYQQPRVPIWVGGYWPHKRPMRRAAQWDGVFPLQTGLGSKKMVSLNTIKEITGYVRRNRPDDRDFDLVHWGLSTGDPPQDQDIIIPYMDAGVTWWLENLYPGRGSVKQMRERIRNGPPTV
jgi:alkanesulfonate monooxygenase SsuD/methylene tetrahydromethanopterin reductase-like flavin-dependent oxidoreductase (luciferase family)